MSDPYKAGFAAANLELFRSGEYFDITVKCGSREWQAHQVIICGRSKFFAAACDGPFKVSYIIVAEYSRTRQLTCNIQESITKVVELKEDDPDILEKALLYMYTLDYHDGTTYEEAISWMNPVKETPPDASSNHEASNSTTLNTVSSGQGVKDDKPVVTLSPEARSSALMVDARVYAMADKLDIPDLKMLAQEKFNDLVCGWPVPHNFADIVQEVFTGTPQSDHGLCSEVAGTMRAHIREFTADRDDEDYRGLASVLSNEGEFIFDELLSFTASKLKTQENVFKTMNAELSKHLTELEAENKTLVKRGARLFEAINTRLLCHACSGPCQPWLLGPGTYEDWAKQGTLKCKTCGVIHDFSIKSSLEARLEGSP